MAPTSVMNPLFETAPAIAAVPEVPESLRQELSVLAHATDNVPARSRVLFQQLRKMMGQPRLVTCLVGIQTLARDGDPAGARLLAALLDANTPGSLLLPRIRRFSSARRLLLDLMGQQKLAVHLRDWCERLEEAASQCTRAFPGLEETVAGCEPQPGTEPPFPVLKEALRQLSERCTREGTLALDEAALLAELVRLEVDAYQERVSSLAGDIDPYKVTAVARVLPVLSRADGEIRDQRQLVGWIGEGDFIAAFQRRVARIRDVLDGREIERFLAAIDDAPELAPLGALLHGLDENPLPVQQLAATMARLMALAHQLVMAGHRRVELDAISAIRLVQEHQDEHGFRLPLEPEMAQLVGASLMAPQAGPGIGSWSLEGLEALEDGLVLHEQGLGLSDHIWKHDLPTLADTDPELAASLANLEEENAEDEESLDADLSVAAVRKLVMNNIGSTSIVLGFLRNPKITAIPGLVATVARRTRSMRVLEVIASSRSLYTGHANKEVPLACLQSPCNVPIKVLRKFVHVKYVAKVDLKRLGLDKAGIRPEVVGEVQDYLQTLK